MRKGGKTSCFAKCEARQFLACEEYDRFMHNGSGTYNMNASGMQNCFVNFIREICPIKDVTGNIFMGDSDRPRAIFDKTLRRTYNTSPSTAFQLITTDTTTDCCPEEQLMFTHSTNKQSLPYDLIDCNGGCIEPCINACSLLPFIKSGRTSFDFLVPDLTELIAVTADKYPTAPGRNKVTYRDILSCDPEMKISHRIFEK